jgi:5-formyltetrahydrofolate cyclo-ligase
LIVQDETPTKPVETASTPHVLHDQAPALSATPPRPDDWSDISRWRKAERRRLIDERLALNPEYREAGAERIANLLDQRLGKPGGRIVGTYWPFRGEPDLRNWGLRFIARGGHIALPVVIAKGRPLDYRVWRPGDPLERGVWNILVPVFGPAVEPDIVIAPVVGFDALHYRLGYGGGFFDRTLAAMKRKPLAIGVGFAQSRLATIHPQPHDIAMDMVITD